ncbi:hypothetical protein ABPG72_003067 [Tetrahymena utriculariae]
MDKYQLVKNLGDGTYGTVFKAINKENGEIVAIKKMKRKYRNWDECMSLREVKSLRKMNHPNLVKLKEVLQIKDELMLVFEYVDLNLYQMYMSYKEKKTQIPESVIKKVIYQIALGLDSLHNTGYFHRDLKPENLLVNMSSLNVKVCDFGLAREVRCRPPFTEYVSTRWYRAPEILLHSQNYNSPIDVFALGCIMAELYNLQPLFSGQNEVDQFYKIISILGTPQNWNEGAKLAQKLQLTIPKKEPLPLPQVVPRASLDALQLLGDMLQYDPLKRPTAIQITKYPYFDDIRKENSDSGSQVFSHSTLQDAFSGNALSQQKSNHTLSITNIPNKVSENSYKEINNPWFINNQQSYQQQQSILNENNFAKKQNTQSYQSFNTLNLSKPSNPFQQYKDEFLKNQNIYSKQHVQDSNYAKRAANQLLYEQQQSQQNINPASSTNYHFASKPNLNGAQNSGLPFGGTLERPLNFNNQYDLQKMNRRQNNLLKKNYENLNSIQSKNEAQYFNPQKYSGLQNSLDNQAAAFFNQFNKAQVSNNNYQNYHNNKNSSLPPEYRNVNSESETQQLNKMLEDKLNWAF